MLKVYMAVIMFVILIIGISTLAFSQSLNQKANGLTVQMSFLPNPPKIGKSDLTIAISNVQGKPVSNAKVLLHFSMPSMGMDNMGKAKAEEVSPGTYKAATTFSMEGDWNIKVTITQNGNKKQTVMFAFKI